MTVGAAALPSADSFGRKVSVVLVSLNCQRLIDFALPSLLQQDASLLEIVVVDNGSSDGTLALVANRYPGVRVIALGRNAGFSAALNRGIRETSGEFVLSLNFDVVLERAFVRTLAAALASRPDVGWVAGAMRRLTWDGVRDEIDCVGHYLLPSRYCYGYDPAHPSPEDYRQPAEVFGASACAALYRRTMLEALALDGEIFDEDLFAYFEDVDLDWRAQRAGFRCLFVPDARGAHMRGGTDIASSDAVAAMLVANRLLVMLKNDGWRDVLRDASPIARRTVIDFGLLSRRRWSVPSRSLARFLRLSPTMLRKRWISRRTYAGTTSPVRRLCLATRFLG